MSDFFSFINHCLSSLLLYLYFHHLQHWSSLPSSFHGFLAQCWKRLFSSGFWVFASTLCFNLAFSWTCKWLERSFAQKIVSNMLWKLAELTGEAVDQYWKLETAMEILATAAVPSKAIALLTTLDTDDTHTWSPTGPSTTALTMPMMIFFGSFLFLTICMKFKFNI